MPYRRAVISLLVLVVALAVAHPVEAHWRHYDYGCGSSCYHPYAGHSHSYWYSPHRDSCYSPYGYHRYGWGAYRHRDYYRSRFYGYGYRPRPFFRSYVCY